MGSGRQRGHAGRKAVGGKRSHLQSAIEYLTTYGWALLIIAAIFLVFFNLNLFSNNGLRAVPGSCKVFRPNGPYTTQFLSIVGFCKNLPPETVADFGRIFVSGSGGSNGNGGISYPSFIEIPNPLQFQQGSSQPQGFTLTSWVYWYGVANSKCQGIFGSVPGQSSGIGLYAFGGNDGACGPLWINGSYVKWPDVNNSIPTNEWIFISAIYNYSNGTAAVYVNNNLFSHSEISPRSFSSTNDTTIGAIIWPNSNVYSFNGLMTNVQLYNTPLSGADLSQLYLEGIGGDPISIYNLVGWWPLNGDAVDYSGNGNTGTAYNLSSTSAYPTQ